MIKRGKRSLKYSKKRLKPRIFGDLVASHSLYIHPYINLQESQSTALPVAPPRSQRSLPLAKARRTESSFDRIHRIRKAIRPHLHNGIYRYLNHFKFIYLLSVLIRYMPSLLFYQISAEVLEFRPFLIDID